MKSIKKGCAGYLDFKKRKDIFIAVSLSVVALIIFFIGLYKYNSRLNILTVVCILLFLPCARRIVYVIVEFRFKSIDKDLLSILNRDYHFIRFIYDILLVSQNSFYLLDVIAISSNTIYGFTSSKKAVEDIMQYIKKILKDNDYLDYNIVVFNNKKNFLDRLDGLEVVSEIDGDTNPNIDEVINLLLSVSV